MSATVELEPALRRRLDNLPVGDPDAQPPELVEVWIPGCEGRHIRPLGALTDIDFGAWSGPSIPSVEVEIHVRNVQTGREVRFPIGALRGTWPPICEPGVTIQASNCRFAA